MSPLLPHFPPSVALPVVRSTESSHCAISWVFSVLRTRIERPHGFPGWRHPHPSCRWILCSLAHCLPLGRAVQAESNAVRVSMLKISITSPTGVNSAVFVLL